jgi:hypothetical protein
MEVKIWGVVEGPISIEEIKDPEDLDFAPEGSKYFMVCKTEIDGEVCDDNFWFDDFDSAYEWQKHFSKSIDPIVVDMTGDAEYN